MPGVAQRDQFLGEPRQHQARIAHHRQQHLAQRLRLTRVQAERRRPVTRQSERPQALQCDGDLGRARSDDARSLLGSEARARDHRACQQRVGELGALGEATHDLGSLGGEGEIGRDAGTGALERRACPDDGIANLRRAELTGLHVAVRKRLIRRRTYDEGG